MEQAQGLTHEIPARLEFQENGKGYPQGRAVTDSNVVFTAIDLICWYGRIISILGRWTMRSRTLPKPHGKI